MILSGKYHPPIAAYKVGTTYYLSVKQAGELYGGQVYWYPVSGRMQMSLRGQGLSLLANSDIAKLGNKTIKMSTAVIPRSSQAFIPLSFFLSNEFSNWAGIDSVFNPGTRLLTVDRRSSVGPVHWFSYEGYTRIVLGLAPKVVYNASPRGVSGFELRIPLGVIESSEQAEIQDSFVNFYSLRQTAKAAVFSVKLAKSGIPWQVKELQNPRRLVMVFGHAKAEAEVLSNTPKAQALAAPRSSVKRRIIIDAGHGGKDPGAAGRRGTLEKDINLRAAMELASLFKEEEAFEVLLTRSDDTFVPLAERSRRANEFGADIFISLHCNASHNPRDSGFEVYFLSEKASDPDAERLAVFENSALELEGKSAQGEQAAVLLQEMTKTENINAASELAALVARDLSKRVSLANRGVKQAAFYVLRGTHAPAILLEMAYVSNKKEEAGLESRKFRRRIIEGLYAGVLDYAKRQGWIAISN